ncbi:MAG TPA: DUF5615 family PIN-like protein [Balneolales bacterium]|nr:DUF5615 family PIN-like protein [Balneolales bacterium]
MRIRFYLDEDVPSSFAQALSNRGVDTETTQTAGNIGCLDRQQLLFASREGRVILTHNKRDFIILHNDFVERNLTHGGIVVSDQLPIGTLLKRAMKLWFTLDADDMYDRLEFLSNWK